MFLFASNFVHFVPAVRTILEAIFPYFFFFALALISKASVSHSLFLKFRSQSLDYASALKSARADLEAVRKENHLLRLQLEELEEKDAASCQRMRELAIDRHDFALQLVQAEKDLQLLQAEHQKLQRQINGEEEPLCATMQARYKK
jgi:septal ring factor EnvC (AmiA/AmiB activator)